MKISIITVCRNCVGSLITTLNSALTQQHHDTEYLVVDGASTDGTQEFLERITPYFGKRLRWISEPDSGIYDAMNKGLNLATGDVVGFLNADDVYCSPAVLRTIEQCFHEHPETDAVHANLEFVNADGRVTRRWAGRPYRVGAFQHGWMPAHPTFYCRRKCYEQFGTFDCTIGSAADFELMLRFIEKHHIRTHFIPQNLISMRTGGVSTAGWRAVLRNTRLNQQAFRKNGIFCPWHYCASRFLGKINLFQHHSS